MWSEKRVMSCTAGAAEEMGFTWQLAAVTQKRFWRDTEVAFYKMPTLFGKLRGYVCCLLGLCLIDNYICRWFAVEVSTICSLRRKTRSALHTNSDLPNFHLHSTEILLNITDVSIYVTDGESQTRSPMLFRNGDQNQHIHKSSWFYSWVAPYISSYFPTCIFAE